MHSLKAWWGSLVCVGLCVAGGGLSALSVRGGLAEWYPLLDKPAWTPPNAVFGPVWTVLYLTIGLSAWWIIRNTQGTWSGWSRHAFLIQLGLNWAWSPIFFGLRQPGAALIEIGCLWIAIAVTIRLVLPISRLAAYLLIPYLGWVTAATALTYSIWRLNP